MGHWKELSDEELQVLGLQRKFIDDEAQSDKPRVIIPREVSDSESLDDEYYYEEEEE